MEKLGKTTIKVFLTIFLLLFTVGNAFFSTLYFDESIYKSSINILVLLLIIIILLIIILLTKNKIIIDNSKAIFVFVMCLFMIQGIIYILDCKSELINYDDSYNVFKAALEIARNNYDSVGYRTYINVYPNNLGLMTYFLMHIKVFGELNALLSIRIMNLLFVLIGYIFLYRITNLLFCNNITRLVFSILVLINGQFVYFSTLIYGNAVSYSLAIVSIFYLIKYIKKRETISLFLCVLSISFSITIKLNSLIVLIAECIYLLIDFIKNKTAISTIAILLLIICQFLGTTGIQKYWGNKVEIDYSQSKLPTICWIANGINYDSRNPGRYTNQFEVYHMANDLVPEYTAIEAKRFINDAINYFKENPKAGIEFYAKKFLVSFANPTYECLDEENVVLETIWDASSSIVAIGLVIFLIKDYKKMELNQLIGLVVIIGGFLFHAFWETKAIYCYQYYLFLLPYAACGLSNIKRSKN